MESDQPVSPSSGVTPDTVRPVGIGALATSAGGVYGLIIVAGMIVVSSNLSDDTGAAFLSVVATLLVFFAAHVYAAAVSWMVSPGGTRRGLGEAFRHGLQDSAGLLLISAIPLAVLALGVVGLLRDTDAVWLALGTDVLLLGALGWLIAATRTDSIWARLGGALLTAAFGGILIALKALVHH
ncbi:hypothetical protein [Microbacterium sp. A84]|uniref:hypothetical protein n=1 Tax=Microbacterium sp. A84 TaxID=3450715 RepID=UPI003F41C010